MRWRDAYSGGAPPQLPHSAGHAGERRRANLEAKENATRNKGEEEYSRSEGQGARQEVKLCFQKMVYVTRENDFEGWTRVSFGAF